MKRTKLVLLAWMLVIPLAAPAIAGYVPPDPGSPTSTQGTGTR